MHLRKTTQTRKVIFQTPYSSLGSRGRPEPIPAAQAQGGSQSWTGHHALTCASHVLTRMGRLETRHAGSLTCTRLGLEGDQEPPEKTCRCWEKAQTPRRQLPQVGVDFLVPSRQCHHVTTLKETTLSQDLLY